MDALHNIKFYRLFVVLVINLLVFLTVFLFLNKKNK